MEKMLDVSEKDLTLAALSNMLPGSSDMADDAYEDVDNNDDRSSVTMKQSRER